MIEALRALRDLKEELEETNNFRSNFVRKMEYLTNFIERELDGVISEIDEGIDRITELEHEVDELQDKIDELERESE